MVTVQVADLSHENFCRVMRFGAKSSCDRKPKWLSGLALHCKVYDSQTHITKIDKLKRGIRENFTLRSYTTASNCAQRLPDYGVEQGHGCVYWDSICGGLRLENGDGWTPIMTTVTVRSYPHHMQCYTWSNVAAKHNVTLRL